MIQFITLSAAVKWLKYDRYGEKKPQLINQSIIPLSVCAE